MTASRQDIENAAAIVSTGLAMLTRAYPTLRRATARDVPPDVLPIFRRARALLRVAGALDGDLLDKVKESA